MSLLLPHPVFKENADRAADALRRSLDDLACVVTAVQAAEIYGKPIYLIQVALNQGPTLIFSLHEVDNGANGVQDDVLVQIRQAAGQTIAYRPRPSTTRPGKYFTDIISLDPPDDPEPS